MAVEQGIVVPPTPAAGEETAEDEAGSTMSPAAVSKR
jgi:hypothetical protein